MSTALTIYVNTGTVDSPYGDSGTEFTSVSADTDYLVFTAGSTEVADGQAVPSETDLIQAGTLLTTSSQTVQHYLLADISANQLKEIHNAGDQNKQYVFAFSFDGATASEPVLEVWDDTNLDSATNTSLGAGTANSSWFRGITTTTSAPGADWTGSYLAGSTAGNFLWLNDSNGALTAADVLYCNLKIVIPGYAVGTEPSGLDSNVIVIKYASN
jgi:hypothetical protein